MSTPHSIGRARQRVLGGCLRRAFARGRLPFAGQARFIVTFAAGLGRDNDAFPVSFTRVFAADPVWTDQNVPGLVTAQLGPRFLLDADFVASLAPLPDSMVDHDQVYFGHGRQRAVARYVRAAVAHSARSQGGVTPNVLGVAKAVGDELAVVNASRGKPDGAAVYHRVAWGGDGTPPVSNLPEPPAGPRSG